ncbi:putative serine/threonine-protein kinase [Salvia miltiorrhiza]|uniref:putative serine/threonine-protein kinase n=1 Tax=Salvia miltiorrhiza TaxID=226208 RepID=UPI0025AD8115|nr:putative serine/threonine-protein kinase [Salvia miltiorrhiza]XP_057794938.1 putative serine/threonine-protein kinase [Salvia miltiorrhiza]XP_057794939.1 putative serine/threonine-protein kinase [Salvia miltiorrhiza]XP_057794940.1 putative serine/threonine-protein kinase [Salvia miltiorrhiza]
MSCGCFGASTILRKSSDKHVSNSEQDQEAVTITKTRTFSFNELRIATNNFNLSNKIGRGGFGIVYKGILRNGMVVAVKLLSAESKQGEREFLTEIETISNVKHPNLVQLLGCCVHGRDQILVYEYLENNSIDRALLGPRRSKKLDWRRRSAICLGTARGLSFLHEQLVPRIVHRDIKGSNVLLDADFQPKIGDFGLAKLFPDNISHITTKIAGTTGYLAPEYALGGHLTVKADVYSYGILTLEIVSGRTWANADHGGVQKLLAEWAWELYQEEKLLDLVDPELEEFPENEVLRYVKVALFCTQAAASRRPLMSQVIEMLSRNVRLKENELTPPGFFDDSASLSGRSAKDKLSGTSNSYQMNSFPSTITQVTPR